MGSRCCAKRKEERRNGQSWKENGEGQFGFLEGRKEKEAVKEWREEIGGQEVQRCRAFRIPAEGKTPKIPAELRKAPKEVASRSFQLASGHAMMTVSFIKENLVR